jgi:hypothetical protein
MARGQELRTQPAKRSPLDKRHARRQRETKKSLEITPERFPTMSPEGLSFLRRMDADANVSAALCDLADK